MKTRWSVALSAAAALAVGVSATAAYADTVPREPKLSWQTNGALVNGKNPTGTVYATVLGKGASEGLVFVGGNFTSLKAPRGQGGTAGRVGVAALNKFSGDLVGEFDAGLAVPTGRVEVRSLALSGDGGTLYVGGKFNSARGAARKNLVAVDSRSGAPRGFVANAAAPVKAMALSGDRLFIGGDFNAVNGQSRLKLAAVNAATGAVAAGFRANITQQGGKPCPPRCPPNVTGLDVSGSTLYVGGTFGFVNGVSRNSAAAVDTGSGAVRAFNPDVYLENNKSSLNKVYDIEAHGDRVFLCGDFFRVDGANRPNVAAVDATTGKNKAGWVSSTDGAVNTCDIDPAAGVFYLGGHFDKVGGPGAGQGLPGAVVRRHVAKLNPQTGDPIAGWDPVLNSTAGAYAIDSEFNRVVVGGQFTLVNFKAQQGVAIFG